MTSSPQEILLVSSPDGPIMAYNASTGTTLTHFSGSHCPRRGLAHVGKTMIAASHISPATASASICLYNWWSSTAFYHLPMPEPVAPITTTADGSFLFAGGISGHIHALSLPSGDLLRSLPIHRKPVTCLTINDDGSLLISGGDDGLITVLPVLQLLDVNDSTQSTFHQISAHSLSITAIISGVGGYNSTTVSCSLDCTCKFWNLANGTQLRTIQFPCPIWSVTMDPIDWVFYAGGSNGQVHVGALKVNRRKQSSRHEAEVVALSQEHCGAVTGLVITNEGRNLVTASEDGVIWVWEMTSRKVVRVLGKELTSVSDLMLAKGVGGSGGVHSAVEWGHSGLGFAGREICRPLREKKDMERWLAVVEQDRKRAMDVLEGAFGTYGKLLTLFLKEVKGMKK
ncbi:hypothetical protein AAC387_Pa09g0987 [Persea americana]